MRFKDPRAYTETNQEDKGRRLKDFIVRYVLEVSGEPRSLEVSRDLLLVARSTESPVLSATLSLTRELAAIGAHVNLILLPPGQDGDDIDTLMAKSAPPFEMSVRVARHPRLVEAHEQLVLGDRAIWYGDSMRRDPLRRDAFESYAVDGAIARLARLAFARLWQVAEPMELLATLGDVRSATAGLVAGSAAKPTVGSPHQ